MSLVKKLTRFIKLLINKIKSNKAKKIQKTENQVVGSTYIDLRHETDLLDVDLIDKNASDKNKRKVRQFTKKIIIIYTVTSSIWITWSYLLATYSVIVLANVEPMSSLSEKVCDVISGYIITYCLKAFFETFAEKGIELIDKHINNKSDDINNVEDDKYYSDSDE